MAGLSALMPSSVKEAVEVGIPMVMVQKTTDQKKIMQFIEFELIKVQSRVNVNPGLGLQTHQVREIAEIIYDHFKNESMEDISLALKRGSNGLYGEIFRIDGAVIVRWIQMYLEDKYQLIESGYQKQKTKATKDEMEVDYRAYAERIKKKAENQQSDRLKEARKDVDYNVIRMRYEEGRKKFLCDGYEVSAMSDAEAAKAFNATFGREPKEVKQRDETQNS